MSIKTTSKLLTESWTADVATLERAIGRFDSNAQPLNACQIVFFEVSHDADLHVNVTHRYRTTTPRGWAGPALLPAGFVHNRTFDDSAPAEITRRVREMVFAKRT